MSASCERKHKSDFETKKPRKARKSCQLASSSQPLFKPVYNPITNDYKFLKKKIDHYYPGEHIIPPKILRSR